MRYHEAKLRTQPSACGSDQHAKQHGDNHCKGRWKTAKNVCDRLDHAQRGPGRRNEADHDENAPTQANSRASDPPAAASLPQTTEYRGQNCPLPSPEQVHDKGCQRCGKHRYGRWRTAIPPRETRIWAVQGTQESMRLHGCDAGRSARCGRRRHRFFRDWQHMSTAQTRRHSVRRRPQEQRLPTPLRGGVGQSPRRTGP